jgi:hypothetical protein
MTADLPPSNVNATNVTSITHTELELTLVHRFALAPHPAAVDLRSSR